jgi:hypothetical protein
MYKLCPNHPRMGIANSVIRTIDGAIIPFDPQNSDYIAYLKWIDAGNTPTPADEGTQ